MRYHYSETWRDLMGHYDDRQLSDVTVYGIQFLAGDNGGFSAAVAFDLTGPDTHSPGPLASIEVFVPAERDASLAAVSEEAVDRALDVLARIVAEDRSSMKEMLNSRPSIGLEKR